MTVLRAALFQGPESSVTQSVSANLDSISEAAEHARARSATVLVTPEMSATGYNIGDLIEQRSEPPHGPIGYAIADIARRNAVAIVYGYPEAGDGHVYNAVRVVGPDGETVAHYRKTHLFGDLDRDHFTPGGDAVVQFDLGGVRCGIVICYDVEFPETVRAHADRGTEWLIVPTGLMSPYEHVAEKLVPTRAYESQVFVSYVNRTGVENGLEFCGLSTTVAPDGVELVRAGRGRELLVFDVDTDVLRASRSINTHLEDRRSDLYGKAGVRSDLYGKAGGRSDLYGKAGGRSDLYGKAGGRSDLYGKAGGRSTLHDKGHGR